MKKNTLIIIIAVLVIALGLGTYFILQNKASTNEPNSTENDNKNNTSTDNDTNSSNDNTTPKKVLVVYFSAQGHTEDIAKKIAANLDADIFEIEPKDAYTSSDLNYSSSTSRVSKEHDDESLRNVELKTTKVDNWDSYDTVLIGYPIWWGIAAWPVNTFVKANDFTNKTVIPFCTSASSGLGNSGKLLAEETNTGTWQEGHRFSSSASDSDIKAFTDSLK